MQEAMRIIPAEEKYCDGWAAMRQKLWDSDFAELLAETKEMLDSESEAAFLLLDETDRCVGFIEGALYSHEQKPYGYVEGWYIEPEYRKRGWGSNLMSKLEQWILHHGIALALSDTIPDEYPLSSEAHLANDYRDLMTIRVFIKDL